MSEILRRCLLEYPVDYKISWEFVALVMIVVESCVLFDQWLLKRYRMVHTDNLDLLDPVDAQSHDWVITVTGKDQTKICRQYTHTHTDMSKTRCCWWVKEKACRRWNVDLKIWKGACFDWLKCRATCTLNCVRADESLAVLLATRDDNNNSKLSCNVQCNILA